MADNEARKCGVGVYCQGFGILNQEFRLDISGPATSSCRVPADITNRQGICQNY